MKYSEKVLIEPIKEKTGRTATANPNSVANVNAKQGSGTGNPGTPSKRAAFKADKAERAPVADAIVRAYGERAQVDYVDSKLEPVRSIVKPKKFSR